MSIAFFVCLSLLLSSEPVTQTQIQRIQAAFETDLSDGSTVHTALNIDERGSIEWTEVRSII